MSARAGKWLVAPVALLGLAAGCQLLIGLDGGNPRDAGSTGGTGGSGGSTSTSTGGSTTTTSSASTSTSSTSSTSTTSTTSTTTSSSSTTSSTSTTSTTTTTTSAPTEVLLLAGGGTVATVGSRFDGSTWATPQTIAGAMTADDLSVADVASGEGLGLVHAATSDALAFTSWNGTAWSSLTQLHTDTTRGRPALVANGGGAYAVFQNPTVFTFSYETWSSGKWGTSAQAVVPTDLAQQACGPSPAVLAPLGTMASLVFVNGGACGGPTNDLRSSDLGTSGWTASTEIATNPINTANTFPAAAVAAPSSGPELVVAYVVQSTQQIYTSYRTASGWSTPAPLTNGLTNDPVALAPVKGGGALMAYRGTDTKLYTASFSGMTWAVPAAAFSPNVTVNATPAVALGVGTATVEMAYVDASGALWHTRYSGTAWGTATQVGTATGFAHVAIASGP